LDIKKVGLMPLKYLICYEKPGPPPCPTFSGEGDTLMLTAINPADGSIIRAFEEDDGSAEVAGKIAAAHEAFLSWRKTTFRKRFEDMLVAQMQQKQMGNPLEEGTEIGPQARAELRDDLHRQVVKSMEKGARCLLCG
jgi:acyl-CoA reductase-like NAD-dependent aldehyde dehydrogenase